MYAWSWGEKQNMEKLCCVFQQQHSLPAVLLEYRLVLCVWIAPSKQQQEVSHEEHKAPPSRQWLSKLKIQKPASFKLSRITNIIQTWKITCFCKNAQ
jgi:hypothetical protein